MSMKEIIAEGVHHTEPPRTRRKPMLWQKLGLDRDPEFEVFYFIRSDTGFSCGTLKSIVKTAKGKEYLFERDTFVNGELKLSIEYTDVTHYCEPVNP